MRLEKALADERADLVGTPVGPITEPTSESHEPAPAAQQEPASSSSGPAAPMPTHNLQNEQMDSPMELGPQERRERKGARPSETPTSEISEASVTSNDRADSGRFGSRCPLCSCIVQQGRDDDRWRIDGIDVVATLVPEEDVWQFEATETCTTEAQMQDREQESIAVVDYEDPSATEAIEAYDARTGEKLDSEEVRKGRTKDVRELDEFEVKMEVDESEMRSTPGKDPNSSAIRCRLCATEVNTGESRSDTFAATPPLKFVRLILSRAASYKPKRANASMIIAVFDISVAFFHGKCAR